MSGGSWDYIYCKIEDVAARLKNEKCPHRRALAEKLFLIADALYQIEWVDSGDNSSPEDINAIKLALGDTTTALGVMIQDAKDLVKELNILIKDDQK